MSCIAAKRRGQVSEKQNFEMLARSLNEMLLQTSLTNAKNEIQKIIHGNKCCFSPLLMNRPSCNRKKICRVTSMTGIKLTATQSVRNSTVKAPVPTPNDDLPRAFSRHAECFRNLCRPLLQASSP